MEPPIKFEAIGEEIACDFGDEHGVCFGAVTKYDEEEALYAVVYNDGDSCDFDDHEYHQAWHFGHQIRRGKQKYNKAPFSSAKESSIRKRTKVSLLVRTCL